ncbi:MAG: DEAD/DEAH box helicase [Parachlamydiaceae bacterium]|nr:DEAD/DEAH box helicase [Parachlamydiaceae bacterium]
MSDFSQFALDETILQALAKINYDSPSAIQAETIPLILQHRDLIALAQTGSGKTAACAIPLCQLVDTTRPEIQALIIVPTRELALQYATEAQKIGLNKGVKAFAIFGGESAGMQQSKLKNGVQILVSTPGRLIDFIYSRDIDLTHVKTLVLDEADEMLSMGFYEDLKFVIQCMNHEHQTLLFSATMPKQIRELAKNHMKDPLEIVLTAVQKTPEQLDHRFIYCRHDERPNVLASMIKELNPKQSLIFCHSRIEVEKVCRALQKDVQGVDFFHAGLSQEVRTVVTNKFRSGKISHLVATDVVSRGLDFSGITHVFIYHLGDDPDIYVHRAGRTGRYDKAGMVVTLVTDRELGTLKHVLETIKQDASWIGNPPPERGSARRPRPQSAPRGKPYRQSQRPPA